MKVNILFWLAIFLVKTEIKNACVTTRYISHFYEIVQRYVIVKPFNPE